MSNLDSKIIGSSRLAVELKKMIQLVASSNAPVIINGATGTGKELVAEALHDESRRKGNFVALNCAAIPSELMEAELFGFEKGAFTGAIKTSKGKFELANKGTLFLDEIGDMPESLQTKLLRVLEGSTISRVGASAEIKLDVRVVCATHKDLAKLVKDNIFREDLLYRLNVFPIKVPTLKERASDIPKLIEHFINKSASARNSSPPIFTEDALRALSEYDWPGNIREIRNVIERSMVFFPAKQIDNNDVDNFLIRVNSGVIDRAEEQSDIWQEFDNLGTSLATNQPQNSAKNPPSPQDFSSWFDTHNSVDLRTLLRDIEIVLIEAALNRNSNNTSEAAKDLKLQRTTLIEKSKKFGLN
jgi:sigma-54 specific flagellar transcriptional regulator A